MSSRRLSAATPRDRNAVVLQCIGSGGAYEIGVMKALFDGRSPSTHYHPFDPGVFTATAIGALSAAFLLSRPHQDLPRALRELETVWQTQIAKQTAVSGNGCFRIRGNPLPLLFLNEQTEPVVQTILDLFGDIGALGSRGLEIAAQLLTSPKPSLLQALRFFNPTPFFTLEPLFRLARRVIDTETLRRCDRRLEVVLSQWKMGTTKTYCKNDLAGLDGPAILTAACSLPGLFGPYEIGGELFTVGEDATAYPLQQALEAGATHLHVIGGQSFREQGEGTGSFEAMSRTILMSWSTPRLDQLDRLEAWNDLLEQQASKRVLQVASAFLAGPANFSRATAFDPETPQRIVVHKYHPSQTIDYLSLIDFHRKHIAQLIELGERDAIAHDCKRAGCVGAQKKPEGKSSGPTARDVIRQKAQITARS